MADSGFVELFRLGSGGMGTVTLAVKTQGGFERLYALKRLKAQDDAVSRKMFLTEARLAGLIRHPNVVSVLDAGEDERGPYLVMDWVDGVSLSRFATRARTVGPVGIALACRIVAAVARGLHASHSLYTHDGQPLSLVHRDVSPQNVLLSYDGTVRVIDFGIAKAHGRGPSTSSILLKGKVSYMSPEQLRFERVDCRSDIYSLGVVLFELLADEPFYLSSKDALESLAREVLHEPPRCLGELRRDVPPELDELLFSMLAKDPASRPETAKDVADTLLDIAEETPDADETLSVALATLFRSDREEMRARIAAAIQQARQPAPGNDVIDLEADDEETLMAPGRLATWTKRLLPVVALLVIGSVATFALQRWDRQASVVSSDTSSTQKRAAEEATLAARSPGPATSPRQAHPALDSAPPISTIPPERSGLEGDREPAPEDASTVATARPQTAQEGPPRRRPTGSYRRAPRRPEQGRPPMVAVPSPGEGGWH